MWSMRLTRAVAAMVFVASVLVVVSATAHADPVVEFPGYSVELLASGLDTGGALTLGPDGDLYATYYNPSGRVLRLRNPSSSGVHTWEVIVPYLPYPTDLTFAFGGRLIVATSTSSNSDIFEVLDDGSTRVFATGFSYPIGMATSRNYVYVGVAGDGTIARLDSSGNRSTFVSNPDFLGPHGPFGVSADANGNIYFVVHGSGGVYKADRTGTTTQLIGSVTPFGGNYTLATRKGDAVFVSDQIPAVIYVFDSKGKRVFASGFAGKTTIPYGPGDMVLSPSGTMYVVDGDKVWRISPPKGSHP